MGAVKSEYWLTFVCILIKFGVCVNFEGGGDW